MKDRAPFVVGFAIILGAAWGLAGAALHPTAGIVGMGVRNRNGDVVRYPRYGYLVLKFCEHSL